MSEEEKSAIEYLTKKMEYHKNKPLGTYVWLTLDEHYVRVLLNLIKNHQEEIKEIVKEYPAFGGDSLNPDCHDVWENIPLDNTYLDCKWEKKLAKATKEKELNGTLPGFYNISDLKAIEICLEETKYKSNLRLIVCLLCVVFVLPCLCIS